MKSLFVVLLLSTLFSAGVSVYAGDELLLTGKIKNVDYGTKKVTIDVRSSSCRGERQFSVDFPSDLEPYVGKVVDFSIDSSSCKDDSVHTMYLSGRKPR